MSSNVAIRGYCRYLGESEFKEHRRYCGRERAIVPPTSLLPTRGEAIRTFVLTRNRQRFFFSLMSNLMRLAILSKEFFTTRDSRRGILSILGSAYRYARIPFISIYRGGQESSIRIIRVRTTRIRQFSSLPIIFRSYRKRVEP